MNNIVNVDNVLWFGTNVGTFIFTIMINTHKLIEPYKYLKICIMKTGGIIHTVWFTSDALLQYFILSVQFEESIFVY